MKAVRLTLAALTALYGVLWLGGVVSYLFLGGPPADAGWTASAFLALAGVLVFGFSPLREWPILLGGTLLGFVAEAIGVTTGVPFGSYRYTDTLAPHLLGVPLVMSAAWLVLFAYIRQMRVPPVVSAVWLTAIDLVIDPLAAGPLNYWKWAGSGPYYGIPWSNFAGWLAVSLLLFAVFRGRAASSPRVAWLGVSVVGFFTVIAFGRGLELAGAIGAGLVILHAAWAWRAARRSA